jgi:hypothetical protein
MAKNTETVEGTENVNAGDVAAPGNTDATTAAAAPTANAPAAAASGGDTRFIVLTLDQEAATAVGAAVGSTMNRKDYILKRWGQGVGRGPISKELTRLQGKPVPYQIVFQATNKVPGGPAPAQAPAAPAAAATTTPAPSPEAPAAVEEPAS